MERKLRWGVCTVCIPRESYYWLYDWMAHHIKLGATKIVIYDNTGSKGSTRKTSTFCTGHFQTMQISKRGEPYGKLTDHLSDEDVQEYLHECAAQLNGKVEIVRWTPMDAAGNIVHGQVEAYANFIRAHRKDALDWAAFIDMDEYLYHAPGLPVDSYLEQLRAGYPDVSCVQLRPYLFRCRWGENGPLDINTLRDHLPLTWGMEKNLVRLKDVKGANIHWGWSMAGWSRKVLARADQLAICHYNQSPDKMEKAIRQIHPRRRWGNKSNPPPAVYINLEAPIVRDEFTEPIWI